MDSAQPPLTAEALRLQEDAARSRNWKRWGPYLSERQWATVREDYSATGDCWTAFPYEQSLSRAYRWGEDGLLGFTDRECRLCFSIALWNGRDPHLKERLFGLTNPEGNHSEDVKECYYYLDATPTHSYCKSLYKYPQAEFPYQRLREENRRRGRHEPEYELMDTGVFSESRYFDVLAEYAKALPDDILIRITVSNRGPAARQLHLLPTLWFRNTWSWHARYEEGRWRKPTLRKHGEQSVLAKHDTLGHYIWSIGAAPDGTAPRLLFTENETNSRLLYGDASGPTLAKDAFHDCVMRSDDRPARQTAGTKAAAHYVLDLPPGESATVHLRLTAQQDLGPDPLGAPFQEIFQQRLDEANEFYRSKIPQNLEPAEQSVARQAYAGLLWSKQFYEYVIPDWITGDAWLPLPADVQAKRANRDWRHLFSRDVLSVPDKWEYPAFFAWDLAFHMIPLARIDADFAKKQLLLLLREWYLHPNGQLPAFEYDLSAVNPPVHAWACLHVFRLTGGNDHAFLERAFHKLLLNFTWWINREDPNGHNVFAGGFLGMDNIGVFDRSRPLPTGGHLQQADGTAWMGFYCTTMLAIALELACWNRAYEDVASKFFEHFVQIADALNHLGGSGLWHEEDGFYYDQLRVDGHGIPLTLRSLVGIVPLLAIEILHEEKIRPNLPEFDQRMRWFREHRKDLWKYVANLQTTGEEPRQRMLLSLANRERLARVLRCLLDENEFLSPYGVRSLSRIYKDRPYVFRAADGQEYSVSYSPGDMENWDFGGNSNWRGPVWFPLNYLLIEALEKYHHFFGDSFQIECPTGSGQMMNLQGVARHLSARLAGLFCGESGPCHANDGPFANDPHWRDYVLFYEYFHGDNGRGLGASHQTGWTALIASTLERCAAERLSAANPTTA